MKLSFQASQRAFEKAPRTFARFANAAAVCEGWYPVARAARLSRGEVRRVWIGERDLVLYRDLAGALQALDRRCPHLGADLAQGRVVEQGLQCAFHGWCWGPQGVRSAGSAAGAIGGMEGKRRIRSYAAREKWGLAWIWAGDGPPAYELPEPQPENRAHVLRLPPQRLACHPHVMLGNGLDLSHVGPVHRFRFEEDPALEVEPPHRLSADVHARFGPTWMRRLLGLAGRTARWRFTTIGPSLAWVQVSAPTPFELVWAGRPLPGGGCAAQTLFFLPRRRSLVRALPMMVATTWADRRILEGIEFTPGFVASDSAFALYAELLEDLPEWTRTPA
ncbi:MAG TPA: Rieske 2Fe-2S domain-containing protein [Thermoanaerobaculia bacterium]|nr:Rieske 2Fe-2S domain-containing protein [Thermoanaerobaculia bacterium]